MREVSETRLAHFMRSASKAQRQSMLKKALIEASNEQRSVVIGYGPSLPDDCGTSTMTADNQRLDCTVSIRAV